MQLSNTRDRYGSMTICLHWIIAVLMISLIILGWYLTTINYYHSYYHILFLTHKSVGMITLLFAVFNLIWYIVNPKPKLPNTISRLEKMAAHVMHDLLFLLTIALPITGYFMSTAKGAGISIFNWFTIPPLFRAGHQGGELAGSMHFWLGYTAVILIFLHTLAALKHEFINKDSILRRMLGL